VIASLHWGIEDQHEPTADQRETAEAILADPAVDLIIGHHAHVVQPIEQVNGRWVVFGLGNQLSGMGDSTGCCDVRALDGLMVRIAVAEQADGTFLVERPEAIPTYLGRRPYRVVPVLDALEDPALRGDISVDTLHASLERTSAVVGGFLGAQASSGG
jgi:poly-gamma-glutamate synthesis protein (capsule biosynthesis protein)